MFTALRVVVHDYMPTASDSPNVPKPSEAYLRHQRKLSFGRKKAHVAPPLDDAALPWDARIVPACVHALLFRCLPQPRDGREAVDLLLQHAYRGLDGYCETDAEVKAINSAFGESASTYGEVTLSGGRRILKALGLSVVSPEPTTGTAADTGAASRRGPAPASPSAVFVDLGSGVGKLVALAALECPSVDRSIGVEIAASRHLRATKALERLHASLAPGSAITAAWPDLSKRATRIQVTCGDMLQARRALSAATHVYLSSLLFDQATMGALAALLLSAAPKLIAIASLAEFPPAVTKGSDWVFELAPTPCHARMDWHTRESDKGAEVFIYLRQPASSQASQPEPGAGKRTPRLWARAGAARKLTSVVKAIRDEADLVQT